MAVTFCPVTSRLVKFGISTEAVYGTFLAATEQMSHRGVSYGRNHSPVDGSSAHGTTQNIITDRSIRGTDAPSVDVTLPLRDDTVDTVMEVLLGGTKAAGTWPVSDAPPGYSITIDDTIQTYEFGGCRLNTGNMRLTIGSVAEVQLGLLATSLVEGGAAFPPALVPGHASRPYVLTDATLRQASAPGAPLTGATPVPFRGITINIARNVIVDQANSIEPNCLTASTFDVSGTIDFWWSAELRTAFAGIIATSAGGYSLHYVELLLIDGAGSTLRLQMPVRLDIGNYSAPQGDGPVISPITFFAGGDDGVPTTATILATDS